MGMQKQNLKALVLTGLMLSSSTELYRNAYNDLFEKDDEEKKKIKTVRESKAIIPKNHKELFYGLNSVFALNKRNADKKAKSKGYL